MVNIEDGKKIYPDWLTDEGKDILGEMQELRNSRMSGMEKFKRERSKIMELAYICMENTNSGFGECQKKAWNLRKNEKI